MSSSHSSSIKLLGTYIQLDDCLLNHQQNTAVSTLANHLQIRMVPHEEVTGLLTSNALSNKKRPFNHEEADNDMHDKKKKKIEASNINSQPKLLRKFTIYKNKAWGCTWKSYFANNPNLDKMKLKRKVKANRITLRITKKPLAEEYRKKVIEMGGSEPVLFIEKPIYSSDIDKQLNRLSMPFSQIISKDFLKEEEKVDLVNREDFWVTVIDPCYREWELTMRKWNMHSDVYVLNCKKYQDFVKANNLQPNMMVQLWSFRVGTKLCFVFVKLDDSD